MSEDYTYPTTPTLADLRARVAELERQLAQADSNMVALAARNAELAAQLADALEVALIRGESLGYVEIDNDYRIRLRELRPDSELLEAVQP